MSAVAPSTHADLPPVGPETIGARCDALFPRNDPIVGYVAIARAVSRLFATSCSVITAKRLAAARRPNRLPVWRWQHINVVFLLPQHLRCWAILDIVPAGASAPKGAPPHPAKSSRRRRP